MFLIYLCPYRGRKALENRTTLDDDKIEMLEHMVKEATEAANDSERKYEEVRTILVFWGNLSGNPKSTRIWRNDLILPVALGQKSQSRVWGLGNGDLD